MPKNSDMLVLDQSFGQILDADYYHRKMGTPKPEKKDALFDPWQNKDFKQLIDMIKQINNPSVTDAIFFLMMIPHNVVDALMKQIKKINTQTNKDDGRLHDFSIQITNNEKPWGGITYVIGSSAYDVISRLQVISSVNKYRAKAEIWLALGANNVGDIQCIIFNNQP